MSIVLLLTISASEAALFPIDLNVDNLTLSVLQVLGPGFRQVLGPGFRLTSPASSNSMASFKDGGDCGMGNNFLL